MGASKKVWVTLPCPVRFLCTVQNMIMAWCHLAKKACTRNPSPEPWLVQIGPHIYWGQSHVTEVSNLTLIEGIPIWRRIGIFYNPQTSELWRSFRQTVDHGRWHWRRHELLAHPATPFFCPGPGRHAVIVDLWWPVARQWNLEIKAFQKYRRGVDAVIDSGTQSSIRREMTCEIE